MDLNQTVDVEYIGQKDIKHDNVAGTNVVWDGPGDVRPVPVTAWPLLAKHPNVWRLAAERALRQQQVQQEPSKPLADPAKVPAPAGSTLAPPSESTAAVPDATLIELAPGVTMTRAELAERARLNSGLTADEWAELPEDDRPDFTDSFVEQLRNAAVDAKVNQINPEEAAARLEEQRAAQAAAASAAAQVPGQANTAPKAGKKK